MNKYNDHIQAIKNNYPTSGYSALCEALDCAVDLMSKEMESAEKCECTSRELCEYCVSGVCGNETIYDEMDRGFMAHVRDGILNIGVATANFHEHSEMRINYCPMCGGNWRNQHASDKYPARHHHRCTVRNTGQTKRYVLCRRTGAYRNDERRTESMAQRKGVIACIISIGSERKNYTTVN